MKERYAKVGTVTKVEYTLTKSFPPLLQIAAAGTVPTSGWGIEGLLAPRIYLSPPSDGVWDLDFLGPVPEGMVLQVVSEIFGQESGLVAPKWLKGVRVHASLNSLVSTDARLMKGSDNWVPFPWARNNWVPYPWSQKDDPHTPMHKGGEDEAQALSSWTVPGA